MSEREVHIIPTLIQPKRAASPEFAALLRDRRIAMRLDGHVGKSASARTYPVLAVLAPVMTTHEEKIEFPGDPMCLYSALSYSISNAQLALHGTLSNEVSPYNDFCPAWGRKLTRKYRFKQGEGGIRPITRSPNTDETIFDPRVWNKATRDYLVKLLREIRPLVVMISSVSPAHRYALEIAQCVKDNLSSSLTILGGRHADETIRFDYRANSLSLAPSSAIQAIESGEANDVVDFVVAGQAYYSLDLLLRSISLGISLDRRTPSRKQVVDILKNLGSTCDPVPGRGTILVPIGDSVTVFPTDAPYDLASLPSPYRHFAIRARFPIFASRNGKAKRTAHMLTANSCPYHCSFCSESHVVVGQTQRFRRGNERILLDRILEYVSYGAEALFFDESIFLSGDFSYMLEFAQMLVREKLSVASAPSAHAKILKTVADKERFLNLEWGAQLTVNLLLDTRAREVLKTMYAAGCSYLYVGIESLAEPVTANIDKYKRRNSGVTWEQQVTLALTMVQSTGIRVGSSVLFGLDGETDETIDHTIGGIKKLIDAGLLFVVSPNILTYHPGTEITLQHGMVDRLDYTSTALKPKPPYTYFEEAYPGVVSTLLSENTIWQIHQKAEVQWTTRNRNKMKAAIVPEGSWSDRPSINLRRRLNKPGWLPFRLMVGDRSIEGSGRVDPTFSGGIKVPESFLRRLTRRRVPKTIVPHLGPGQSYEGHIDIGPVLSLPCSIVFTGREFVIGHEILMGRPEAAQKREVSLP